MQIIWEGQGGPRHSDNIIEIQIYTIIVEGLHTVIQSMKSEIYCISFERALVKIHRKTGTFLSEV